MGIFFGGFGWSLVIIVITIIETYDDLHWFVALLVVEGDAEETRLIFGEELPHAPRVRLGRAHVPHEPRGATHGVRHAALVHVVALLVVDLVLPVVHIFFLQGVKVRTSVGAIESSN